MKNVLFYTDTPGYGGAEKQMGLLARYLPKQGYEVSLACGAYAKTSLKKSSDYKTIYTIPALHKHDPRHYFGLKKILKQKHFDLIHIHLWNPGACRYAFWAAKHAGLPIVTTEHDPFPLSGIKKIIRQKCLKMTDQIITISSDNYRQIGQGRQVVKDRLNKVYNGIELDEFLDIADTKNSQQKSKKFTLICIAELHPRKGHRYLIEAFRKIKLAFPNLQLKIIGTGPTEVELKERYESIKGLQFMGWIKDIKEELKKAEVLILPSKNEAFGLVLVEAMASGVLPIAFKKGGPKDIIVDRQTGLLAEPKNVGDLANKIKYAITHPEELRQMQKNALQRAKAHFGVELMVKKTAEVYSKINLHHP